MAEGLGLIPRFEDTPDGIRLRAELADACPIVEFDEHDVERLRQASMDGLLGGFGIESALRITDERINELRERGFYTVQAPYDT
jgi:hypothetical protein